MQTALTDILVRSITPPTVGRTEISDARCVGLTIRVTCGGAKSWSFRFRDPRTSAVSRVTIGTYPDISLSEARQQATALRKLVASGQNPNENKRRHRADAQTKTFAALAERYLKEHSYRFKRSAAADERNLRIHVLPQWSKLAYDSIQRRDVIQLCEGLVASGKPTQANRVQALISSIFSFGVDVDLLPANPCFRLKKRGLETARRRVLTDSELQLFWTQIVRPPVSLTVGLALRLTLLTGVRASEAAGASRSEFEHLGEPSRASWTIPAERTKNRLAHYLPLSSLAQETVNEALALAPFEHRYLFPSPFVPGSPIKGHALAVAMNRFAKALSKSEREHAAWVADVPSPHDLRRTFATRLASLGTSGEDISALLNHSPRGVTAIHYNLYSRASEKRRGLETWAREINNLLAAHE